MVILRGRVEGLRVWHSDLAMAEASIMIMDEAALVGRIAMADEKSAKSESCMPALSLINKSSELQ